MSLGGGRRTSPGASGAARKSRCRTRLVRISLRGRSWLAGCMTPRPGEPRARPAARGSGSAPVPGVCGGHVEGSVDSPPCPPSPWVPGAPFDGAGSKHVTAGAAGVDCWSLPRPPRSVPPCLSRCHFHSGQNCARRKPCAAHSSSKASGCWWSLKALIRGGFFCPGFHASPSPGPPGSLQSVHSPKGGHAGVVHTPGPTVWPRAAVRRWDL